LLGRYPTPVQLLSPRPPAKAASRLWVKRDDQSGPWYGGNKVRKLEIILRDARARGRRRLVTIGAAGSHHVLATTVYGRREGFEVEAVLVPQVRTDHARTNLRVALALGLTPFCVQSYAEAPFAVLRRMGSDAHFVAAGGSSVRGALGYVDAARELAEQIAGGLLPVPDLIVTPLGTGGTVAGLAAGLELLGLRSRILAVSIAPPPRFVHLVCLELARRALRIAGGAAPASALARRIVLESRYLGQGYGHPTAWGALATKNGRHLQVALDTTYTAKAFAAAIDRFARREFGEILYWHTLSSVPIDRVLASSTQPLLPGPMRERDLPPLPPDLEAMFR
jgi:D-cysteine desulfhydrase